MSFAQLKEQAAHLQITEQRELIAFLISKQTEQDEDFQQILTKKIDDTNPENWVELGDLRKRYTD